MGHRPDITCPLTVMSVECDACLFTFLMYQFEDFICGSILASSFPPAFDNPFVISKPSQLSLDRSVTEQFQNHIQNQTRSNNNEQEQRLTIASILSRGDICSNTKLIMMQSTSPLPCHFQPPRTLNQLHTLTTYSHYCPHSVHMSWQETTSSYGNQ